MTPASKSTTPATIRADQDGDRRYLIRPEDKDMFVRTGRQIIEACQLGISVDIWWDELQSMVAAVQKWCAAHAPHVASCFVTPHSARVQLFFCPRSNQFDFELASELADLNSDLVKTYNVGMIEVRQVPAAEVDRFLNPERAWHIYGDKPGTHQAVVA